MPEILFPTTSIVPGTPLITGTVFSGLYLEPFVKFCTSLYSQHIMFFVLSSVMPLLQAFNASDYKWSPYASMVQLELLEVNIATNTDYAVRLLYHGQERIIPYCSGSPCSLAQFSDYIKEIVSSDPKTDCKLTNPKIMNGPHPGHARRARILF